MPQISTGVGGLRRPFAAAVALFGAILVGAAPAAGAPADSSGTGREDERAETLPTYTLDVVEVRAERPFPIGRTIVSPAMTTLPPAADGGDFLRLLPGITGGRMGGHGIEPVIRGQQQTQLNVLSDGALIYGGCPNRMDPPSAISNFDTADRITVLRGKQSVTHGSGGPGGTVLIEHLPPTFAAGHNVTGRFSQGFETNGERIPTWANIAARRNGLYLRGTGRHRDMGDYTGGDGAGVRSAFTQYGGGLSLGWSETPIGSGDVDFVEGAVEFDRTEDALFAGAGMDAPRSESRAARVRGRRSVTQGPVTGVWGSAFFSDVDHEMDNFTLRARETDFRRAITESRTLGGRLLLDLNLAATPVTAGADFQYQQKNADRLGNNTDPTELVAVQSILWPEITLKQIGVFAEGRTALAHRARLIAGVRYDRIAFTFGRANERPTLPTMKMFRSPNDLYRTFYGIGAEDAAENNLGGLIRLEYETPAAVLVSLGLSRTLRTADPTERALASEMGLLSRVGNPAVSPERHHQVDLGAGVKRADWRASLSFYMDRVDDYIFRDAARGQPGIFVSMPQADVYRNIDAVLAGAEFEGAWSPVDDWRLALDAAYTYGENREIRGPLAQIPPLQGTFSVRRAGGGWAAGTRFHAAVRQTRVDLSPLTGSGRDLGKTPGYATIDLFGSMSVRDGWSLRAGVSNLLDQAYANHLNRGNSVDNEALQVYEPGRSLYLRMMAEF